MLTQKISISLSLQLYEFIKNYQIEHHYKSRSEVISKALNLLQSEQLEACYLEANKEIDGSFDSNIADGIDHER